jgi:hypothetical protein
MIVGGWAVESLLAVEAGVVSAPVQVNAAIGKGTEMLAAQVLRSSGYWSVGSQVRAVTSAGVRIIDHLVRSPESKLLAIEVKSSNAMRTVLQVTKDNLMATEGALPRGSPVRQVIETIVMRF